MKVKVTHKPKWKQTKRRVYGNSSSRHKNNIPIFLARLERAIKQLTPSWQACIPLAILIVMVWSYAAVAQDAPPATTDKVTQDLQSLRVGMDTLWVSIAAFLVFFMNAGFCMLETGFCRQKNAVNVLAKNLIVFAISTVAFWAIGFGLMFGDGNPFFGTNGWFLSGADNSPATGDAYQGVFSALNWTGVPLGAKFLFQLVFAGTAATIVSGRWLACKSWILGLCRIDGSSRRWWLGGINGSSLFRASPRQISKWAISSNARTQHEYCDFRCFDFVVRMVWV